MSTALVAVIAIGQFTGAWRLAPVLSGSMEPNVPKGAMVVAEQVDIHALRVGDVMLFNAPIVGHPPVVHRVREILEVGGRPAFRTKGDANDAPDAWTIHLRSNTVWRVAHVIPYAGHLVGLLHEAGLRVVVLIGGAALLTLTGLVAIWHDARGRDDEEEDEDEDESERPDPDDVALHPGPPVSRGRRRGRVVVVVSHAGQVVALAVAIFLVVAALTGVAQALFTGVPTNPAATYASGSLSAPSALACTWTGATALNLTWTDNSPTFTTGYTVNRATVSGGPYSTNVGTTVGETSKSIADASPGPPTLHYYVAAATHGNWSSANSAQVASNACIASINLIAGTTAGFSGDNAAATAAKLSAPAAVAVDSAGNVYIADTTNNRIRKVTASTGIITTIAGGGTGNTVCTFAGTATSVTLNAPRGVAVDASGNVYIADTGNNCIRKVAGTAISQVAGGGTGNTVCTFSGTATSVTLNAPGGVALDSSGNLYIADTTNNCVRKVVGTAISQVAGGGASTACNFAGAASGASLSGPSSVAIDSSGRVVIADTARNCIRLVTGSNIALMAGTGTAGSTGDNGPAVGALLSGPAGVAANSGGDVWIADTANSRVRRVEGPV